MAFSLNPYTDLLDRLDQSLGHWPPKIANLEGWLSLHPLASVEWLHWGNAHRWRSSHLEVLIRIRLELRFSPSNITGASLIAIEKPITHPLILNHLRNFPIPIDS